MKTGGEDTGCGKASAAGLAGVLLSYACLAFPDAIGVVADRLRLGGFASALVFAWFAVLPIPAGIACGRFGSFAVAVAALVSSLPALALMTVGGEGAFMAAAGLALMGAANVVLQVALPSCIVELFGRERQSSTMTIGIFLKTLCVVAIPFVVAALAAHGSWRLFFPMSGAAFVLSALLMWRSGSGASGSRASGPISLGAVVDVARDWPSALAALAFAGGVVADVAFNLSVPDAVRLRFSRGDSAVGTVYAVLFGVKLPVMLAGAWMFAKIDARRYFPLSILVGTAGAVVLAVADGFAAYLAGVALFAVGYANVYGFVFAVASPRHSPGMAPAVSALLVTAIAGGAVASPAIAALGAFAARAAESLVLAATALLLVLSAVLSGGRRRCV